MMKENYIYEVEGVALPTDDSYDNMFYYYKRQTPKQTITIKHNQNIPTEVDIYNDSDYHDIDTDEELDMDYYEDTNPEPSAETNDDDILNKLTKYLATIPISAIGGPTILPKRLTKSRRQLVKKGRHTKRANRALPKNFY